MSYQHDQRFALLVHSSQDSANLIDLMLYQYVFTLLNLLYFTVTSPAGAVAKYFDEFLCLCVCASVYLSVCLSDRKSPEPHARSLPIFCMLPMSVARSSSGMLTLDRIAYRREGGDVSAQRGRSVIYDCLVFFSTHCVCQHSVMKETTHVVTNLVICSKKVVYMCGADVKAAQLSASASRQPD